MKRKAQSKILKSLTKGKTQKEILKSLTKKMQTLFDGDTIWIWDPSDEMDSVNGFWNTFYNSIEKSELKIINQSPEIVRQALFGTVIPPEMAVSIAREFLMRGPDE